MSWYFVCGRLVSSVVGWLYIYKVVLRSFNIDISTLKFTLVLLLGGVMITSKSTIRNENGLPVIKLHTWIKNKAHRAALLWWVLVIQKNSHFNTARPSSSFFIKFNIAFLSSLPMHSNLFYCLSKCFCIKFALPANFQVYHKSLRPFTPHLSVWKRILKTLRTSSLGYGDRLFSQSPAPIGQRSRPQTESSRFIGKLLKMRATAQRSNCSQQQQFNIQKSPAAWLFRRAA